MMDDDPKGNRAPHDAKPQPETPENAEVVRKPGEVGGPKGPEPTRYGDWEKKGRCIDF